MFLLFHCSIGHLGSCVWGQGWVWVSLLHRQSSLTVVAGAVNEKKGKVNFVVLLAGWWEICTFNFTQIRCGNGFLVFTWGFTSAHTDRACTRKKFKKSTSKGVLVRRVWDSWTCMCVHACAHLCVFAGLLVPWQCQFTLCPEAVELWKAGVSDTGVEAQAGRVTLYRSILQLFFQVQRFWSSSDIKCKSNWRQFCSSPD